MTAESKQQIDVFGIEQASDSHSCEWCEVHGAVLEETALAKLSCVQVATNGRSETNVSVHYLMDGIEHCCAGFSSRADAEKAIDFHGKLAQTVYFSKDIGNLHERKCLDQNKGKAQSMMVGAMMSPSEQKKTEELETGKKKSKPQQ